MSEIDKSLRGLNEKHFLLQSSYQVHFSLFRVVLRHTNSWKLFHGEGDTYDKALDNAGESALAWLNRPQPKRRVRLPKSPKKRVRLAKRRVRL